MKNIIIFGGAGFIGTNLTKRLLDKGNKVMCVDNYFTGRQTNINQFLSNENYYCLVADITEKETFIKLENIIEDFFFNSVDEIYNLACPASPPKYQIDPIYTIHISLAIEDVCKLAIKYNAKMMHSSTSFDSMPALLTASLTTSAPRSVALIPDKVLPNLPIGVLFALRITISSMII